MVYARMRKCECGHMCAHTYKQVASMHTTQTGLRARTRGSQHWWYLCEACGAGATRLMAMLPPAQGLCHSLQQCHPGARIALQPTYCHPHRVCSNATTYMWCTTAHLLLTDLPPPAQGSWQCHRLHDTSGAATACTTLASMVGQDGVSTCTCTAQLLTRPGGQEAAAW